MKRADKRKILIPIIIALIIVAAGILFYFFVIKPAINGYVVNGYKQGVTYAVYSVMQQASTCKPVPLYLGSINMSLIWVDCLTNPVNFVEPTNQTAK